MLIVPDQKVTATFSAIRVNLKQHFYIFRMTCKYRFRKFEIEYHSDPGGHFSNFFFRPNDLLLKFRKLKLNAYSALGST